MGDWFEQFMSWFGGGDPKEYIPQLKKGDSYKNSIIIDKGSQHLYS